MLTEKDFELIRKYDVQGPRYTSYPTVPQWSDTISLDEYNQVLQDQLSDPDRTIAIYTHIPFCEKRCHYCACNVVITKHKDKAEEYLSYLKKELALLASQIPKRKVTQIHWGGGTPTYLTSPQMESLFSEYAKYFTIDPSAEISIEVDPRVTTHEQLKTLKRLGFNRLSMGVQDFDTNVQSAINRGQTEKETFQIHEWGKALGFTSVNMDFVYGLPHQTEVGFEKNIKTILKMNPDRIAFYNYAHVPWLVPAQRYISEASLPNAEKKFSFLKTAFSMFEAAGYLPVGMDHFAKPHDELIQALNAGTLRRNFMGYTTQRKSLLLAYGVSSISDLDTLYVQNVKKLSQYYRALDDQSAPFLRGHRLSKDDQLRRRVIVDLLCTMGVDIRSVEADYGISFFDTFKEAMSDLETLVSDGLLTIDREKISMTSIGRLLSRNVALCFDAYFTAQQQTSPKRYSRTI